MQNTQQLLMIRPVNFGFNDETAVNNPFQNKIEGNIQQKALQEFDEFVRLLEKNKIAVLVIEDTAEPFTPDSIYPNNWVSFHENGQLFLYAMFAANRRKERKASVLDAINEHFSVSEIIDLSKYEADEIFLEGTGSMVLDRENKIAYASLSSRTNEKLLNEFCKLSGFTSIVFHSVDATGVAIYHTNVMMCMAGTYTVICLDSVKDIFEREAVIASLKKTGKEVIVISLQQLNSFAGNMLQVKNTDEELLLIMSSQAYQALTIAQIETLQKHNRILHSSLTTIETVGGGSARCMMAEVFLKNK